MNGLGRWWQGLGVRERAFVGWGAVVVAAIACYVAFWEPAAAGIRKLGSDLPRLRDENASLHAMADEAGRLRAAAGATRPAAPSDRVAAVRRSLDRAGLAHGTPALAAEPPAGATVHTLTVGGTTTVSTASASNAGRSAPEVTADGERVRVRFDDIDYGVWVAWLAAAETELAARAARVSVTSISPKFPVGHVRAEAVLDWTVPAAVPSAASRS